MLTDKLSGISLGIYFMYTRSFIELYQINSSAELPFKQYNKLCKLKQFVK